MANKNYFALQLFPDVAQNTLAILCVFLCTCIAIFMFTENHEHQSAQMSKTTNDGLTRSGKGCFIAVPIWQQWVLKG